MICLPFLILIDLAIGTQQFTISDALGNPIKGRACQPVTRLVNHRNIFGKI